MTEPGRRLHVEITGEGDEIIIQGPAWGPANDYLRLTLAPLLSGARVVTFDPRNVGRSPRDAAPGSQATAHLVGDLEEVRRRAGSRRFVLVGHSHGGFVALAYAVRHACRLRGLVLLGASLRDHRLDDEADAILARLAEPGDRAAAASEYRSRNHRDDVFADDRDMARWLRRTLPLAFAEPAAAAEFARRAASAGLPSTAAFEGMPADYPEPWVAEGMPGIDAPTLVVTGRHDFAATPSDADAICSLLPRARRVVMERSGHHPWVEEPEKFRRAIREFIDGLPA